MYIDPTEHDMNFFWAVSRCVCVCVCVCVCMCVCVCVCVSEIFIHNFSKQFLRSLQTNHDPFEFKIEHPSMSSVSFMLDWTEQRCEKSICRKTRPNNEMFCYICRIFLFIMSTITKLVGSTWSHSFLFYNNFHDMKQTETSNFCVFFRCLLYSITEIVCKCFGWRKFKYVKLNEISK